MFFAVLFLLCSTPVAVYGLTQNAPVSERPVKLPDASTPEKFSPGNPLSRRLNANRAAPLDTRRALPPGRDVITATDDRATRDVIRPQRDVTSRYDSDAVIVHGSDISVFAAADGPREKRRTGRNRFVNPPYIAPHDTAVYSNDELTGNGNTATDTNSVEPVEAAGVLGASLDRLVRDVGTLKDMVHALKKQNSVIHRQLKALARGQAAAVRSCDAAADDVGVPRTGEAVVTSQLAERATSSRGVREEKKQQLLKNAMLADSWRPDVIPRESPPSPRCPDGFRFHAEVSGCYRIVPERVTWSAARDRCLSRSADLVTITSARKQRFVAELAKNSPEMRHCDIWIGLTRSPTFHPPPPNNSPAPPLSLSRLHQNPSTPGPGSKSSWRWATSGKRPDYTKWSDGEPNNGRGNENCAQMLWLFQWRWNDAGCYVGNACYACEARPEL